MDQLTNIFAFIFGTIVGSFLNVVSLRMNTGVGIGGRSKCMSCGGTLTWLELIPIFSFLAQRGACKKCKSTISWQYPLVEFIAGALFVLIFIHFPPVSLISGLHTAIYVISACTLLVITAYDIKHKIIPDQFVYAFAFLALVNLFIGEGSTWFILPSFWQLIAGPLLAVPFALLWVVSGGRWMGFGDAKLALGIGWMLGIAGGINAVILAFWIGAAASVVWLLFRRAFKPKTEIPFGPYLILGLYLVLLFHVQVMDIATLRLILMSYL